MNTRKLGRSNLEVSALGLGCMGMSFSYGPPKDKQEMISLLRTAVERGVTFFDTAEVYGPFINEELVGEALAPFKGKVVIATKFGFKIGGAPGGLDSRPEHIKEVVEASLKRLQVETIDLLYQHRVDPAVPIEETIGAMARLVEQGKVRYLGVCEAGPETLRRAHKAHPVAALQTEYSLWFRDVERDLLPLCRELGIAYVAYAPLGRGLLTGRIRTADDLAPNDQRRRHPRFAPENLARNLKLVEELEAMAKGQGVTAAQLALAWMLAQGDHIVPIPGTNQVRNVELNAAAAEIRLSGEKLARLSEIFAIGAGAGQRYHANVLKGVGI